MKVVHGAYLFLAPDHPDHGKVDQHPGRWVLNLALAQKAHASIDPELVVQVPGTAKDFDTEIEGIPVHYLAAPKRFRSMTFFYFDSRRIAKKIRALQPDVVHAHGTEDAYGLAAQRAGLPYVFTAQGLHFLINRLVKPPVFDRRWIVEYTERRFLDRCRVAIAKSEYVASALEEKFPHLRTHRIPNTFDPKLLTIAPAEKEPGVFAYVGRFEKRKGVDTICDALEKMGARNAEVKLHFFGDLGGHAGPYEREQKARLRDILGERAVFHGVLPGVEVASEVVKAQALLAPSREEMFGNQVIEALLVRTHAIVTAKTAMAENVSKFGNGTVVPQEDAGALARAMERALASGSDAAAAARAREAVIENLGPERVAKAHRALYEEMIA